MEELWKIQVETSLIDFQKFQPLSSASKQVETGAKRFKWSTKLDDLPQFEPKISLGVDIGKVAWTEENVQTVHRSSGGSQGVYFVTTKLGAVVIKPPVHSFSSELYSTILSQLLSIPAPRIKVVRTSDELGIRILNCLKRVDPTWTIIARLFDQAYLFQTDFVRGAPLGNIEPSVLSAAFFSSSQTLSDCGRRFFVRLGEILAFDIFLNNADRMPLIWNNQGNGGNLYVAIVSNTELELINLDVQLRAIDPEKYPLEFQAYFDRVRQFLTDVRLGNQRDKFQHIVKICSRWTQLEIPTEQAEQSLLVGFNSLFRQFAPCSQTLARFETMAQRTFELIGQIEPSNPQIISYSALNLAYVKRMTELFSST